MKPRAKLLVKPKIGPGNDSITEMSMTKDSDSSYSYEREQADKYFEADQWTRRWSQTDQEDEFEFPEETR